MTELYQITHSGKYHLEKNLENQDFASVKYIDDNSIIAIVLDGCSEAVFGKLGAQTAGTAVIDYFTDIIDVKKLDQMSENDFGQLVLSIAQKSLIELSNKVSVSIEEFSTTLIAVLVHRKRILTAHLGDGFIAAVDMDDQTDILSESVNINNDLSMTHFVVDDDAQSHLICKAFNKQNYKHMLISTDGFEKALSDGNYGTIKNVISLLGRMDIRNNYELTKCLRSSIEVLMPERLADDFGIVWIKNLTSDDIVAHMRDSGVDIKISTPKEKNKHLTISSFKKNKKSMSIKFKICNSILN